MSKLKELNTNLNTNVLCGLASKYRTDKGGHGYTKIYHEIMKENKSNKINIFEIGIFRGSSLRMWEEYFDNKESKICAIDNGRLTLTTSAIPGADNINISQDDAFLLSQNATIDSDYSWIENKKIKCFTADQRSYPQLLEAFLYFDVSMFDFIVDDGHHYQEHQQKSLGLLFPHLKSGGYYIIEDIAVKERLLAAPGSYWGQKEKDCSDTTDHVFLEYLNSGNLISPYLTEEQKNYIINNIDDIFLFDDLNKNNSPVSCTSKFLVIKKK